MSDALLDVFFNSYLKSRVRQSVNRSVAMPLDSDTLELLALPALPPQFLAGKGVLFAGAGMSTAAGYPTASVLSEYLCRQLDLQATGEQMLTRHRFADIAALANDVIGREGIVTSIKALLDTPQAVDPTPAHLKAVRLFNVIVTTNYDELFEEACRRQGLPFTVKTSSDQPAETGSGVMIYKLDGTISGPETLILTDKDAGKVASNRKFWDQVSEALASRPLAVVGHSLRDTTSRSLLESRNLDLPGVYVGPALDAVDEINLKRFQLMGIRANAEQFMSALSSNG